MGKSKERIGKGKERMEKAKETMEKAKERIEKAKETPSERTQGGSDEGTPLAALAGGDVGAQDAAEHGHPVPADVAAKGLTCSRGGKNGE